MTVNYYDIVERNSSIITKEEQEKIRNSKVCCMGVGGSSQVPLLAARTGFEKFILVDKDTYCASNLNRQMAAFVSNLHQPKVEAAKKVVLDINPNAQVEAAHICVESVDQAKEIMKDTDYVCIGIDDPTSRAIIARAAYELGKTTIVSGPLGTKHFSVTTLPGGISYEQITHQPSFNKDLQDSEVKKALDLHQKAFFVCSKAFNLEYCKDYLRDKEIFRMIGFSVNQLCCWVVAELVKLVTGKGTPIVTPNIYTFDTMTGNSWNLIEVGTNALTLQDIIRKEGIEKGVEFIEELYRKGN